MCSGCKKRFTEEENIGMRHDIDIIRVGQESMKKMSLGETQKLLEKKHGVKISRTSLFKWKKKKTNEKKGLNMKNLKKYFEEKIILVTGGAGSLGSALTAELLRLNPKIIRIFDNSETMLFELEREMEKRFSEKFVYDKLRILVGDIKDKERLSKACQNVDIIFHLAALKHVYISEYNAFEAVKTNIIGTQNVIEAALENNVEKVIYTSSDKAVNPNNTMGATKLLGERLMTSANEYRGASRTVFSSVRFGNVLDSRGSVIPLFRKQIKEKRNVTVTHPGMTRFMMSEKSALHLVFKCTEMARGGENFILKMSVFNIGDVADVMIEELSKKYGYKEDEIKRIIIGPRQGETLYEELMTSEETSRAYEGSDMFIVYPAITAYKIKVPRGFRPARQKTYNSKDEPILTKEEIKTILYKNNIL